MSRRIRKKTVLAGANFVSAALRERFDAPSSTGSYVIDTSNAVATLVNRLSVALDGSPSYGVDFNPVADRLGYADAAVRAGDKGGITEQHGVAERQARRTQVEDWLEEGLRGCTLHDVGHALHGVLGPFGRRALIAQRLANHEECVMSDHVYKLVELVGSSATSTDDAIRNAIETAAKTLRQIDWFEVIQTRGHVADGKVAHFQVTLKLGFRLED